MAAVYIWTFACRLLAMLVSILGERAEGGVAAPVA